MSTATGVAQFSQNSDAEFRAWGSAVSQGIQNTGLVQTADTGQINWSTVVRPGASTASQGYEMYRLNDSLQATKPVFIKFEYGSGSTGASVPAMYITVGTVTNGAGTLGGVTSVRVQMQNNGGASVVATPWWMSGDTSAHGFVCTVATTATPWVWGSIGWIIERTRDATGAATGDGLLICLWVSTSSSQYQMLSFTINTSSLQGTNWPIPVPPAWTNGLATGQSLLALPCIMATPKPQPPGIQALGCGLNDFPRTSIQTFVVSGVAHNYLAVTGVSPTRTMYGTQSIGLLMRYE